MMETLLLEVLAEIRALRRDLAALRHERTPRQARALRRGELLREIARASAEAPASWAAAAGVAEILEGARPAPAGCGEALRRLRADPEAPRSARRILDHLRNPDGIDMTDAALRQRTGRR